MIDEFVETDDRAVSLWTYHCKIPVAYTGLWETLPKEALEEFDRGGSVPCGGDFNTGPWCANCRFGKEEFVDEETFD